MTSKPTGNTPDDQGTDRSADRKPREPDEPTFLELAAQTHGALAAVAGASADRKPREVRGDLIERAKRAVVALRTPDHSLANVANTIRQSIADVIEAQQRWIDRYGLALMMIREGCVDPGKFAGETLSADVTAISALNTIVVTPEMEAAGREWARAHDPSTFADIFAAMWRARPDPHGREGPLT